MQHVEQADRGCDFAFCAVDSDGTGRVGASAADSARTT